MNDRLHLARRHRRILEALIRQYLPGVEVWAYGSRVNGRSHDGSDLDLVLRAPGLERVPTDQLSDFEDALRESSIPFLVEARDWARLPERFHREIERDHVVITYSTTQETTFGSLLAQPVRNGIYKTKEFHGRGVKMVNMGELFAHPRLRNVSMKRVELNASEIDRFSVKKGDLLFARRSLVAEGAGKCCVVLEVSQPTAFESSIIRARPDPEKADSLYIFYYFSSPLGLHRLDTIRRQVAVAGITGGDLASLGVPLPPVHHQRTVAHVLGTLDDKIDLNRRMNETLESMARAIFKDWFVDFGPTRAKAEGRAPYLAPALWDLFPNALDDTGKPAGWMVSEIGKEVQAVGGGTPSTKEPSYWAGGEHHWATPKDLSKLTSPVLLGTDRKITDSGVHKISSGLLPVGTVLLSSRAPIGYLAIAEVPTAINQGFIAMVCQKRLPNTFVLFWCHENLDYIKDISGGSTFAEISKRAFHPVPVVVPSGQILVAYDRLIRPLYFRIVANTKENETLARTRDLLLPKLMSGEIRLRVAEKAIEAVA